MLQMEIPRPANAVSETRERRTAGEKAPRSRKTPLTYRHTIEIFLKDSNAYTNTYFSRYFEWQGICRERWFHDCVTADMLQPLGVLITKHASHDFLRETFPFQKVDCRLNAYDLRKCSTWLLFRFYVDRQLVGEGRQQLLFADHAKRIRPFPPEVVEKIRRYEISLPPR